MKYIKRYESVEEKPKVGDYVYMKSQSSEEVAKLINQSIGKITFFLRSYRGIIVRYDFPLSILKKFEIDNISPDLPSKKPNLII